MLIEKLLGAVVDMYNETPWNWMAIVLAAWMVWPGTMWLVGWIFESRMVPLWKWQSRAFFPGDLTLGVMYVATVAMYAKPGYMPWRWINSPLWWVLVAILAAAFTVLLQRNEAKYYRPRSKRSPTKIWHDIIGYFVSPMILVGLALPRLATIVVKLTVPSAIAEDVNFAIAEWIIFLAALAFYLVCALWWDPKNTPQEGDRFTAAAVRHPEDWKPFWCLIRDKVRWGRYHRRFGK